MAPIFLTKVQTTQLSDEAGILITKRVLPTYVPGPYSLDFLPEHLKPPDEILYVPPLAHFCLKSLLHNVDAIDMGGTARLVYRSEYHRDLLRGLIPPFNSEPRDIDLKYVDPRLWGILIQLYALLPECFATYTLPLADTHLTALQGIRSTADFTLITVLDLASRPEVSDETVGALKPLTNLCVLDLSGTKIGSWGIRKLAMCLGGKGTERRGPWQLRIWSLRGCTKVDDTFTNAFAKFALLSVVDLRDTSVTPLAALTGFTSRPPVSHDSLYHPAPPLSWIPALSGLHPQHPLFESSSPPHILHINKLLHSRQAPLRRPRLLPSALLRAMAERRNTSGVGEQDRVLALQPDGRQVWHTAHGLAQAAEHETAEHRRDAAFLRRDLLNEDRWPYSHESYGNHYHDHESDEGYGDHYHGDHYHSYGSDKDEDVPDHDVGRFDLGDDGGPYSKESDWEWGWEEEEPRLSVETDEQNGTAAVELMRDAADQQARRFYESGGLDGTEGALRLRGGALRTPARSAASMRVRELTLALLERPSRAHSRVAETSTAGGHAHKQARASGEEGRERSLMFFRMPPPFDCVSDVDIADGSGRTARRRNADEQIIPAKRRKMVSSSSGPSTVLVNRLGEGSRVQEGERIQQPEGRMMQAGLSQQRALPVRTRKEPSERGNGGEPPAVVSKNPFLAKKKTLPQGAATGLPAASQRRSLIEGLTGGKPPGQGLSVQSTRTAANDRSATLPAMFAAATSINKTQSTAHKPPTKRTSQTYGHQGAEKSPGASTSKGPKGFDMKAWAVKTKK